jgi:hypothetical protein
MDLVVEYNKDDFLYSADTYKGKINCSSNEETLGKQLCYNKKLADDLLNRTALHSGSDEMYANTISKYNSERLTTFNLAVGILVGIGAIIKFRT